MNTVKTENLKINDLTYWDINQYIKNKISEFAMVPYPNVLGYFSGTQSDIVYYDQRSNDFKAIKIDESDLLSFSRKARIDWINYQKLLNG